jgi:rhodanese-related sulfurtransferase
MKNLMSVVFVMGALSAAACANNTPASNTESTAAQTTQGNVGAATSKVPLITLQELDERMQQKPNETFVFDANSKEHFADGHMPRAKHLAYDEVKAEALPADKNAFLVFYCWNEQCSASHRAAEAAMNLGYTNVRVYGGGIQGWKAAGKTVEK